ncbi:MAG TPA: hypothetical protein PLF22_02275 [Pseudomonadales bacterium]|nr:hypothetical protein [Pseudomonadales bacterium]
MSIGVFHSTAQDSFNLAGIWQKHGVPAFATFVAGIVANSVADRVVASRPQEFIGPPRPAPEGQWFHYRVPV